MARLVMDRTHGEVLIIGVEEKLERVLRPRVEELIHVDGPRLFIFNTDLEGISILRAPHVGDGVYAVVFYSERGEDYVLSYKGIHPSP